MRLIAGLCRSNDTADNFRDKFERLIGRALPAPVQWETEKEEMECPICYSYLLQTAGAAGAGGGASGATPLVPDRACEGENCRRVFHSHCLAEWLRALPSTRQSFDMLFGRCPFCDQSITVKVTGARAALF